MSRPDEPGDGAASPRSAQPITRAILPLVAAVLGAVAAVGAVGLLTAPRHVVVGTNEFVNVPGMIDAHNTPSVARNPRDPANLVVVNRVDRPRFDAVLHWSTDGGRTWRPTSLPLPEGKDRPYAPDVAFGPDGILYVTYVNLTGPGNAPETLWIARSENGGQTLSEPLRVAGQYSFQARLAVDPDGVVHVTYLQATHVGLLQLSGPAPIVATRSSDGGRTFSDPVAVSDSDRLRVGAASPVIDANGDLVVLYEDFKDDVRDFQNLEGPVWPEPFALVLTRSGDGGRSFSRGVELESGVVPTKRFLVFLPEFPSLAAGPDGSLFVSWADGRNGEEDVFLRRSDDGGRTWTEPARVNDNPADDGTSQYLPKVAVAPGGRVDVLFLDRRRDPADVMTDAFLAWSVNRGASFRNVRVSSASFDSRVGPSAASHLEPDAGSELGLASWDGGALGAWTDTRLGSEATGRQDIVGSRLRMPDPGAVKARWLLVAGSLLAAGVALVAWRRQGRWDTLPGRAVPDGAPQREGVTISDRQAGEAGT